MPRAGKEKIKNYGLDFKLRAVQLSHHPGVLRSVLQDLSSNFVQLRYPFEGYSQMNEVEYARVGASWIARGANNSEAHFRYHPQELFGLTVALQALSK